MESSNLEVTINNEYNYSNIVPEIDKVSLLVEYCNNVYDSFLKLTEEDEKSNEKLLYEYRKYNYSKCFSSSFAVTIWHGYNSLDCKNYQSFLELKSSHQLKNISKLVISLHIDFYRGSSDNKQLHENSFVISFEPYNITFKRKSNIKDEEMDMIESNIKRILVSFKVQDSIFYSK